MHSFRYSLALLFMPLLSWGADTPASVINPPNRAIQTISTGSVILSISSFSVYNVPGSTLTVNIASGTSQIGWVELRGRDGYVASSTSSNLSPTAPAFYNFAISGYPTGTNAVEVQGAGANAAAIANSGQSVLVGGSDGTNKQIMSVDTSGRPMVVGDVGHDGIDAGNPVKVGAQARSSPQTAVSNGDRTNLAADLNGRLFVNMGESTATVRVSNGDLKTTGTSLDVNVTNTSFTAVQSGYWSVGLSTGVGNIGTVNGSTIGVVQVGAPWDISRSTVVVMQSTFPWTVSVIPSSVTVNAIQAGDWRISNSSFTLFPSTFGVVWTGPSLAVSTHPVSQFGYWSVGLSSGESNIGTVNGSTVGVVWTGPSLAVSTHPVSQFGPWRMENSSFTILNATVNVSGSTITISQANSFIIYSTASAQVGRSMVAIANTGDTVFKIHRINMTPGTDTAVAGIASAYKLVTTTFVYRNDGTTCTVRAMDTGDAALNTDITCRGGFPIISSTGTTIGWTGFNPDDAPVAVEARLFESSDLRMKPLRLKSGEGLAVLQTQGSAAGAIGVQFYCTQE